MENAGELYYIRGTKYFQLGQYEEAVTDFIQAYDLGYEREQILADIYHCFILPNGQEFQNHYTQNSAGYTNLSMDECTLDFIPVSEERFFIFDRQEKVFRGIFDLETEPIQGEKFNFNNILYTDTWDIREMLPDMKEYQRSVRYIITGDLEAKFCSFFKLPRFRKLYLSNVVIFKDAGLMQTFFESYNEYYLPKQLVTANSETYLSILNELHQKRIEDVETERKNIFLSICIPSYNRGSTALTTVRHLLQCPYDSEIEIILSNNGSTENADGYEEIRKIQDARIHYHAFDQNQGFTSNLLKTLELAKGDYAVLVSDEDLVMWEHFEEYLSYVKSHPHFGVFFESGIGDGMKPLETMGYRAGFSAICESATALTYMTGITCDMKLYHDLQIPDIMAKMRGNLFIEWYPHICIAMLLCQKKDYAALNIELWDTKTNAVPSKEGGSPVLPYMLPEHRMEQQNSLMNFCHQTMNLGRLDFMNLFSVRSVKTQFLIGFAWRKVEAFRELGSEEELHQWIYQEQLKYLDEFPIPLSEQEYEELRQNLKKMAENEMRH